MTNISTATPAVLRQTLRNMRAENLDVSTQLDLIHSDIIGMDPVTFEHNGGNTDPDQATTIRAGRLMVRCLAKNAARTAAKLRTASKAPARRAVTIQRSYPKFEAGMSTAAYVKLYAMYNGGTAGAQPLPYNLTEYATPCTLYENGAIDFDAIEEPIDAPEATESPEMVAIVSELTGATMASIPRDKAEELAAMIGTTVQAARQVSELIASATTAAAIEQASEPENQDEAADAPELETVTSEPDALATTCDASSAGNPGNATTHGRASSAPHQAQQRATHDAHGQRIGQRVAGKSGNWSAVMFSDAAGAPSFEFEGPDGSREVWSYTTGRERMAALQAMARRADEQAQSEDAPATGGQYPATAPDLGQQTAPVPNGADEVPRDLGTDSHQDDASKPAGDATTPASAAEQLRADADEFQRAAPQAFDMLAMIRAGLTPADFIGLGIVYSGDRANPRGRGAITSIKPCEWNRYSVTVTLEDGRVWPCDPLDFKESMGNRFRTDLKRHGAPYLAELAAARLASEASRKAAKQAAADEKERQRRELPQQWPQLKAYDPACKLSGCTLAAHNVRVLLKEKFPGVKFSVKTSRFSGGDDLSISWTDGPSAKAVEAIADPFSAGSFDGMEDIYNYRRSVFTELFGDAKYVFCNRHESAELIARALELEYPDASTRPSVEDWTQAKGAFDFRTASHWTRQAMQKRLNELGGNWPA